MPASPRTHPQRPSACIACGGPGWWNGARNVTRSDGVVVTRHRVRCSLDCGRPDWTEYEDGAYPHRIFGLDEAVAAVCPVEFGNSTVSEAAREARCSPDTIRRCQAWIASLAEPSELVRLCVRVHPNGIPMPHIQGRTRAGAVVALFECLADGLKQRGVGLVNRGFGVAQVLLDQLRRFGVVVPLTRQSPPLLGDVQGVLL